MRWLKKVLVLLVVISAAELAIMIFFRTFNVPEGMFKDALDAALLAIIISPVIYHFVKAENTLRESSLRFRSLMDESLVGVCIFKDGRFVYVNPAFAEITGYSQEELLAMAAPLEALLTEDSLRAVKESIFKLMSHEEKSVHKHIRGRRKGGAQNDIDIIGGLTEYGGGPALFANILDITSRKRAEAAALRYGLQVEVLAHASRVINSVLEIPEIMRSLVASAMEITVAESGHAGLVADGKMVFTEYSKGGKLIPFNFVCEPGKGVPGHIMETLQPYVANDAEHDPYATPEVREALGFHNFAAVPILDRYRKLLGCFIIHNKQGGLEFDEGDVDLLEGLAASAAVALENALMLTEIKRTEREVVEEKNRLEVILTGIGDGISIQDKDMRILYQNPAMKRLVGEHTGSYCYREYEDKEDVCEGCPVAMSMADGRTHTVERHVYKDGRNVNVEITSSPLLDADGGVIGGIEVVRDITERRKTEEAVKRANERLAMLNRIDRAMVSTLDFDAITEILLENLARALKMETGVFFLYDPKSETLTSVRGYNFDMAAGPVCFSMKEFPLLAGAVKENRPVVISRFDADSEQCILAKCLSLLAVPLRKDGSAEGVICLYNTALPHEFTDDEVNFASQVADQAVIAIDNARLVKDLKDRDAALTRRAEELSALNEVTSIIAASRDRDAMLYQALKKTLTLPLLKVQSRGAVFVRDEADPGMLDMAAQDGLSPYLIETEKRIPLGYCLCGKSAQTGEVLTSLDCFQDPGHTTHFPEMKNHGHVVVPINVKDQTLGVMTFYLEPGTETSDAEIRLLTAIASQIGTGILNHRFLERIEAGKKEWENTFDALEELVTIHGTDFTILQANKAAAKAAGMSVKELVGRKCYEVFHAAAEPIPLCPAKALMEGAASGRSYDVSMGDSEYEINVYPLTRDGELVAYVHIAKDITERKRAVEFQLEQAKNAMLAAEVGESLTKGESLRAMLTGCTDAMVRHLGAAFARIWTLNEDENVLELRASSGMYTHIDGPHGRVPVGKFKIGLIAQERMPHLTNSVLDDPRISSPEWARKEGMVAFAGYPLIVGNKLKGVMAMFSKKRLSEATMNALASVADVIAIGIEQESAAESLEESELKFRGLVEQSLVGVGIIQDGLYRYVNPRFAEIFGYDAEEIINIKGPQDIAYAEDWPIVNENIRRRITGETTHLNYTFRGVRKDGGMVTLEVYGSYTTYQGRPAVIGTLVDITERLLAQEELVRKTRETVLLKEASRQLEEINRLKSEFLANMSHELRTPLNAVIGLSQVLLENTYGELNAKQAEYVSGVNQSGQHLLGLINEILDLSKIEAGSERIEPSEFSMADILKSSFIMIKEKAAKHGIALVQEIGPEIGRFYADERRVKQIIFNLLSNAVKFTNPGGKVGLRASQDEEKLVVTVWDTGIGIPDDKKRLIFQPFLMLDSSLARRHEGTGLGLALTKKLVELHGGTITFKSEEGAGTSFTVTLPVVAPALSAALAGAGEPAESAEEGGPGCVSGGDKVMVVEDNRLNMLLAVDYLKAHGCETLEAYDGETAIEVARTEKPGVMLLDIQMPGIDGFEVIRRLREDPAVKNIPVIAMTALAMKGDEERCIQAGFADYISKPVNLAVMLEKVRMRLKKAG